jgi:large subunit ribosomal protein L6
MSRVGKMPVVLPKEVKVVLDPSKVEVKGPKGNLTCPLPAGISVSTEEGKLLVHRPDDERTSKALQGMTRSLVANMVTGVTKGFEKDRDHSVGYRAETDKNGLCLASVFPIPFSFPSRRD